eukprot:16190686-Heterocapsa_arctica.AAC.1
MPQLQFPMLLEMTKHLPLVILSLGGDLDAANVRCKHHYAALAREHNEEARQDPNRSKGFVAIADV